MNLSNVSALAISVPIENLPEKIREIQALHFSIETIEMAIDDRIRIVAKLIPSDKPVQSYDEIDPLLQDLMRSLQIKRSSKKDPYVW